MHFYTEWSSDEEAADEAFQIKAHHRMMEREVASVLKPELEDKNKEN